MDNLATLNAADDAGAVSMLTPLIERAPAIARNVARHRPFESPDDIARAIREELAGLAEAELVDIFRAHPELAPANPLSMTPESQAEQGRLDLTSAQSAHRQRLAHLNAAYRGKFGFPFITALVRHSDMASVVAEFERRLANDRAAEIRHAVDQIATVSSSRVAIAFRNADPGAGQGPKERKEA